MLYIWYPPQVQKRKMQPSHTAWFYYLRVPWRARWWVCSHGRLLGVPIQWCLRYYHLCPMSHSTLLPLPIKVTADTFQLPQVCAFETGRSKSPSHYLRSDRDFFRLISVLSLCSTVIHDCLFLSPVIQFSGVWQKMAASSWGSCTKQVLLVRAKTSSSFPRHNFPICIEMLKWGLEGNMAEWNLHCWFVEINLELVWKGHYSSCYCVYTALGNGVFDLRMLYNWNILNNILKKSLIWEGRVLQFSVNILSLNTTLFSINLFAFAPNTKKRSIWSCYQGGPKTEVLESLRILAFLPWVTVDILQWLVLCF